MNAKTYEYIIELLMSEIEDLNKQISDLEYSIDRLDGQLQACAECKTLIQHLEYDELKDKQPSESEVDPSQPNKPFRRKTDPDEVMKLKAEGLSVKEIAERVGVSSPQTIYNILNERKNNEG